MIEIEAIQKSFRGRTALDGFSLRVGSGEALGLIGPNGAGKTTLIKILATLIRPDDGGARIGGLDVVRDAREVRALVGYVPDVPALYPDMRVVELLAFFADAFHLRGARKNEAVAAALSRAELEGRREALVRELSKGHLQRLLLAKAMLHDPKVLLLDEPTTGLDPLARSELRDELKSLRRGGTTILVSSHILSDLEDTCGRVALIVEGRNATDSEGRDVLGLDCDESPETIYDIEVSSATGDAAAAPLSELPGARVLGTEGRRLRVGVTGGEEGAAAVLRCLVAAGVSVIRFAPSVSDLEERYREVFGGAGR